MRAAFARGGAGIGSVEMRHVPVPDPGPGEALVRITAATLNYRDLIMLKGLLPGLTKAPDYVPLSCAAGVVAATGDGVTRVKVGDRVSPLLAQGWIDGPPDPRRMLGASLDGVARPLAVFDAESLLPIPDTLTDQEAATLPCAGLTAYNALFDDQALSSGPLRPGHWVLVQGTGGVAIAALQWAKAVGARVAILSGSDEKLARTAALGADLTINRHATPDWAPAVRRRLGHGIDIVVDVLGAGSLDAAARVLTENGTIAAIGMLDGPFNWGRQSHEGRRIRAVTLGDRARHAAMLAFAARHDVHSIVDAVYDLEQLPDALRHLESGRFFGKIGIQIKEQGERP
ncbi:zinc-dependent alcohol dehydrogenase family protein [Nitrospirillum iridis]|uniref:NADPH:quinone reductase-like Zn-dependent oxidoreductase n=1 Tax=Nitrospirillum iridis TaxID=765888 RepID=A0A7X0B049_9PROT|nr:NAD(P)-dependent alcohol dehydrogenase [Nitrospirillum iridis]MBB6253324.1 NADPH:quinone reductase-like Zn-dependent oxidoreductase [Nitrospirillum iridis]